MNNNYISDKFVEHIITNKTPTTVFLLSGIKLSGNIIFNDEESLILSRDGVNQLVFRHAIATVMPQDSFSVYDLMDEGE